MNILEEALTIISTVPCDLYFIGGCQRVRQAVGAASSGCRSCVAREALEKVATTTNIVIRGCQGKRRYGTADAALQSGAVRSDHGAGPLRVYDCPVCKGFHLTKATMEEVSGVKREVDGRL